MDYLAVRDKAAQLMTQHGLTGWRFSLNNRLRGCGVCYHGQRLIQLSRHFVEHNTEAEIEETLLHEIAHALTPGAHHGPRWEAQVMAIGGKAQRCATAETIMPPGKWVGVCPGCGRRTKPRHRRGVIACGRCCKRFNGGRFSANYRYEWEARSQKPD